MNIRQQYGPEANVLAMLSRPALSKDESDLARDLIDAGLDWALLLDRATPNGVKALVGANIKKYDLQYSVPGWVIEQLQEHALSIKVRNQLLVSTLLDVVAMFGDAGINAAPIKGPLTATLAFEDLYDREYGDIDIVVPKEQLAPATKLLRSCGYIKMDQPPQYHVFLNQAGDIRIDIQSALEADQFSFSLDRSDMWDRMESYRINDSGVRSFGIDDMLVILCVHGTKDCWTKLKWVSDIAGLINKNPALNWERIADNAFAIGARRKLALGIYLAKEILSANLPYGALNQLRVGKWARPLIQRIARRFFSRIYVPVSRFERFLLLSRTEDTTRGALLQSRRFLLG